MSAPSSSPCPFMAKTAGSHKIPKKDDGSHRAVSSSEVNCPSFASGCPFSSNGISADQVDASSEKCPSLADRRCPLSSASTTENTNPGMTHPGSSSGSSSCPAKSHSFGQKTLSSSCVSELTGKVSHPRVDSWESLSKQCPAFESGCPFKPDSKEGMHPAVRFSSEFVKYLREVCPAFAEGGCPFSGIKSLSDLHLDKCPAFNGSCPFDRSSSQYRRLFDLYPVDISKCTGFLEGCPFNPPNSNYSASYSKDTETPSTSSSDSPIPKRQNKRPFADSM